MFLLTVVVVHICFCHVCSALQRANLVFVWLPRENLQSPGTSKQGQTGSGHAWSSRYDVIPGTVCDQHPSRMRNSQESWSTNLQFMVLRRWRCATMRPLILVIDMWVHGGQSAVVGTLSSWTRQNPSRRRAILGSMPCEQCRRRRFRVLTDSSEIRSATFSF